MKTWVLVALLSIGVWNQTSPVFGQQPSPMAKADRTGAVTVSIGGQARFQMATKKPIRQAFNQNDRIVQVVNDAVDPTYLILRGVAAGTSSLELTDADGVKETYLVVVQRDLELLKTLIRRTVPTATVDVTPIGDSGNSIILSGYAAREDDRATLTQLSEALGLRVAVNTVTVGGGGNVPHVQLDLTLARVDRSKARSRGASWIVNGNTVSGGSLLGGLVSQQAAGGAGATAASVGVIPNAANVLPTSTANLVAGLTPSNIQLLISALRTEGLAKLVSSPTVVARSGEQANLLVGGQVPVISASAGITGPGVSYQNVGTELTFLPVVYGNGKISLTITGVVRSINQGNALPTTFGTSPAFDEQRLTTSVACEPGQTYAIGGLIQTSIQGSVTKVPYLGDIPYVGSLFSFATSQETETELVILVTPRLVDAADAGQLPRPLPGSETRKVDDFEFYLETILEAPRGPRCIFEGHTYKAAWLNSKTPYPCNQGMCENGQGAGCATGNCPTGVTTGTTGTYVPAMPSVPATMPAPVPATEMPAPNSGVGTSSISDRTIRQPLSIPSVMPNTIPEPIPVPISVPRIATAPASGGIGGE
ncbi:MAG: hypothetical protein R3B84_03930 [Zavarzinella sp.]